MIAEISRRALLGAILVLVAGLAAVIAALPAQAAIPGNSGGFDHFVDCAWLMITDGDAHKIQCGPNHVELPTGFPGTGVILTTPGAAPPVQPASAPNCCSCVNSGATIDLKMQMGALVAAADGALWTGDGDSLQEFLLACCPCNG